GYLPQEPSARPLPTVLAECQSGAKKLYQLQKRLDDALSRMAHDHSSEVLQRHEEAEAAFRTAGGYSLEARATEILSGLGFSEKAIRQSPLELSGGWRMRL